jgi:nitroreductase
MMHYSQTMVTPTMSESPNVKALDATARSANPFAARYGHQDGPPPPTIPWNTTLEAILTHRSVRRYSARPLPDGLVELLVAAAQSAPSSSNLQAFSIVAIQDKLRKARLAKLAANQKHVEEAPLLLMFVADLARLRHVAVNVDEPANGLDYTESFLVAVTDAAFAAQNCFIALESLGLGACYIGAMRNHPKDVAEELGLPPGAFVVFGMTIGYPDPEVATGVKPRLPQSIVLHRERYEPLSTAHLDAYDEALREFRLDQVMSDVAWSKHATGRVSGPESLMGRHVLRDVLQDLGFALK